MTRRDFLSSSMMGWGALGLRPGALSAGTLRAAPASPIASQPASTRPASTGPADVTLRIGTLTHDVAPGHSFRTTAYNGRVPGPLVRLREGVPATVEIFNDTDLTELVHWHGLLVPAEVDGTQEEGSWPVPPRGSLRYTMTPGPAGTRYVHSHAMVMGDALTSGPLPAHGAHAQMASGTYSGQFACVYVEPRRDPGAYDQEVFLVTHEWGAEMVWQSEDEDESEASFQEKPPLLPVGNWEVQYDIGSINGRALGAGEPVRVRQGSRVMFRIVNASATATIDLALAGHQFLVTALDGNPVPTPRLVSSVRLGTAERVDAIVEMQNPGVWVLGAVNDDDRLVGRMGIVIEYAGKSGEPAWIAPEQSQPWDYLQFGARPSAAAAAPSPDDTRVLLFERSGPGANGMESWTINGKDYDEQAPWAFQAGRRYRLVFKNRSEDEHPIHLHRHLFEIVGLNDRRTSGLVKDTVLVPPFGTVDVDFTPEQRGLALLHCHMQMHMDNGFKTLFRVT